MADKNFLDLPYDVKICIFKKLTVSDIKNVMLVCKTLHTIIIDANVLWIHLSRNVLVIQSSDFFSSRLTWYNKCIISHNWRKGIFSDMIILRHSISYMPWISLQKSSLLVTVGSELRNYPLDKKQLPRCKRWLWKIEVPQIRRNDIRTNDISRFKSKGEYLACGNRDGCVAVYKQKSIDKPELIYHIKDCHNDGLMEVSDVDMIVNLELISTLTVSNNEPYLKFWRAMMTEDGSRVMQCTRTVQCNNCVGLRCIEVNKQHNRLAIGPNGNSKPILLDVETGTCINNFNSCLNRGEVIKDIRWHDNNIVAFVTHSGKLQCVDVRTSQPVFLVNDPLDSRLYCLKTDGLNAIVVGTSAYSRCILFDIRAPAPVWCVQMYFTQKPSPVYSLDFDSTKLIAAADRSIATLDFNINSSFSIRRDFSDRFITVIN